MDTDALIKPRLLILAEKCAHVRNEEGAFWAKQGNQLDAKVIQLHAEPKSTQQRGKFLDFRLAEDFVELRHELLHGLQAAESSRRGCVRREGLGRGGLWALDRFVGQGDSRPNARR